MKNKDLLNDLEQIRATKKDLSINGQNLAIEATEDFNLDLPYALDVEDTSYFYSNAKDRDTDMSNLYKLLKSE